MAETREEGGWNDGADVSKKACEGYTDTISMRNNMEQTNHDLMMDKIMLNSHVRSLYSVKERYTRENMERTEPRYNTSNAQLWCHSSSQYLPLCTP